MEDETLTKKKNEKGKRSKRKEAAREEPPPHRRGDRETGAGGPMVRGKHEKAG